MKQNTIDPNTKLITGQYGTLDSVLDSAKGTAETTLSLQSIIVFMVWRLAKTLTSDRIDGTPTGNAFMQDGKFSLARLLNAIRQTYRAQHGFSTMLGQKTRTTQFFDLVLCIWTDHKDGNAVTDKDKAMRTAMSYLTEIYRYTGGNVQILLSLFDQAPLGKDAQDALEAIETGGIASLTGEQIKLLSGLGLSQLLKKHGIANGVQPTKKATVEVKEMPKDAITQLAEWASKLPDDMKDILVKVVTESKRAQKLAGFDEFLKSIKPAPAELIAN